MAGRGRVVGGALGGCIAAGAPLLAVDLAANMLRFSVQEATTAGVAGLLGGIVLGGIVAGVIAGRRGGIMGAGQAGIFAAILYALVVVGSMLGWAALESWQPPLLARPASLAAGLVFLGTLMALVALLVGLVVRPREIPEAHPQQRSFTRMDESTRQQALGARARMQDGAQGQVPQLRGTPRGTAASRPQSQPLRRR